MQPDIKNGYKNLKKLGNITTPFGGRTKDEPFHPGVDVANAKGTPIPAFSPGVVTSVKTGFKNGDNGYGNTVQIRDGRGGVHQYAHLQQPLVRPGQVINQNQQIGLMGDSGSSYSPKGGDSSHLDYRVMGPDGKYINPTAITGNVTSVGKGGKGGAGKIDAIVKKLLTVKTKQKHPLTYLSKK
jgi:murein DD-endopeptidase MepM/ murein hydrolase activator NlpD